MTYSAGGLIQAADFNAILNSNTPNFNSIWSTGVSSNGYGQTAIGVVATNALVAAPAWNSLITNMAKSATHQGSTITALTPPVAGDRIDYLAAIATNMTTLNTNRLNCAAVGTDITNSATRVAPWGSGQGIPTITSTITIVFSSGSNARYFFNAGGSILISAATIGGSGYPENLAWQNLCTDIGTIGLPAVSTTQSLGGVSYTGLTKFGGGGSAPTIYVRNGFYNLVGTPATFFRQYSNYSVYTNDYINITYERLAGTVTITMQFVDTNTFFANTVDSQLRVTATARQPETTNIANSWGTPTVNVTAPA